MFIRAQQKNQIPKNLENLLCRLLTKDKAKRISASEALLLMGKRPPVEKMEILDLTLIKDKLEPIVKNLEELKQDSTRMDKEQ